MRITKISVKGLFGMFDHEIPLNQESRITILHGPNGVGKTVLMRMVNGLFNYDYESFKTVPFHYLSVKFDNHTTLVAQIRLPRHLPWPIFEIGSTSVVEVDGKPEIRFYPAETPGELLVSLQYERDIKGEPYGLRLYEPDELVNRIKEIAPDLNRLEWDGQSYWWYENQIDEIVENNELIPLKGLVQNVDIFTQVPEFHSQVFGETPDWFLTVVQEAETDLTDVKRLQSTYFHQDGLRALLAENQSSDIQMPHAEPEILVAPQILEAIINQNLPELVSDLAQWQKEYRESSDREQGGSRNLLFDTIADIGRFDSDDAMIVRLNELLESHKHRTFLAEFLLFADIINKRILYKEWSLTDAGNFLFVATDGSPVPMTSLSSGEQQLFVLYFHLLFNTKPDTLVMIDEPEISMNVVWQRNFLKDLQHIVELRQFDVLIATHSPQIIHDKWDWVVHLGAKVDD